MDIRTVIRESMLRRASDIHIVCGIPIRIRVHGELENYNDYVLSRSDCEDIGEQLCGADYDKIRDMGELDFARTYDGTIRCRINVFRQQKCLSVAIRILRNEIPLMSSLGLPDAVSRFAGYNKGIVLVTGETGSGKSTTLASILDAINHSRRSHIITLEDPIEYIYTPDLCIINQREIGTDTADYPSGLRAILREDPDIILVGEMRDLDTIETALTAAETGHLVFATLHTNSASSTIDRIVDVFPGEKQQQIRIQLSQCLRAVLSQQLLPRRDGAGRTVACEVMIPNYAIRNMIREGKSEQIESAISTTVSDGNMLMDMSLIKKVRESAITAETALEAAHDPAYIRKNLGLGSRTVDRMVVIR